MTRDDATIQVFGRMQRRGVQLPIPEIRAVIDEKYPRENYRTADHPLRDYTFGSADILELEREMRRRLRV